VRRFRAPVRDAVEGGLLLELSRAALISRGPAALGQTFEHEGAPRVQCLRLQVGLLGFFEAVQEEKGLALKKPRVTGRRAEAVGDRQLGERLRGVRDEQPQRQPHPDLEAVGVMALRRVQVGQRLVDSADLREEIRQVDAGEGRGRAARDGLAEKDLSLVVGVLLPGRDGLKDKPAGGELVHVEALVRV
jgi:hypothetical protein